MGRPPKNAGKEMPKEAQKEAAPQNMSKEEQIGFHKGSLSTLAKERQELARILQIVEQLMQMHLASLKELGIDLEKDAAGLTKAAEGTKKPEKPIEDLL